jgi:hypothetical protein
MSLLNLLLHCYKVTVLHVVQKPALLNAILTFETINTACRLLGAILIHYHTPTKK